MGITDRHKKPGGFKKLVHSLETTAHDKRKKILEAMRTEDPDFVLEVESCIFEFDEFLKIDDAILAEVTAALTEMRTLAFALYNASEEITTKFKRCLKPAQQYQLKEATEMLGSEKVVRAQQISAQFKIIEKAREIEPARRFVLKKYSQSYRD